MFKKLMLTAWIALSFGGVMAAFSSPASAAIDSYMYFNDYDGYDK